MNDAIFLALCIVALVLAAIDEVRAKGQSLTAYAVIALAAALLLERLA